MKKIKGILIDSKNLNVSEVEFEPTLEEYYRLLDCDCITAPSFNEDHDVIVDDEGLLKGPTNFFEIDGAEYAGNGMILKVNDRGDWISHTLNFEEIKDKVTFHTYMRFKGIVVKVKL